MFGRAKTSKQGNKDSQKPTVRRVFVQALVAVTIFALGWGLGSGRIQIGPYAELNKRVANDAPARLDYSSVDQLYNSLRQHYDGQLEADKLTDGLKKGLTEATGDPYTEYLTTKEAKQFNDDLDGTFSGIGAELSKDEKDHIIIVAPIAGFPAQKAGLQPRDVIAEIDGNSTAKLSISEAVDKIRGPVGSQVRLTIVRDGQVLDFDIVRQQITVPSVTSKILTGKNGPVGYLKISRFGDDTVRLAQQAAADFKQKQVSGVVLDLRSNPGGLLDASVKVSSLWLPSGTKVLDEKRGGQTVRSFSASGDSPLKGIPTIVLLDDGSASASEITAGALKDNKAATVLGAKSFGKGSVQQLINLQGGSILKVTTARWFRPNGQNIDKKGITPDVMVDRTTDDIKAGRDPQLEAALQRL